MMHEIVNLFKTLRPYGRYLLKISTSEQSSSYLCFFPPKWKKSPKNSIPYLGRVTSCPVVSGVGVPFKIELGMKIIFFLDLVLAQTPSFSI